MDNLASSPERRYKGAGNRSEEIFSRVALFPCLPGGRRRPPGFFLPERGGQGRPLQQDLERELLRAAVSKQVNRSMQVDIDPPGKKSRPTVVVADAA